MEAKGALIVEGTHGGEVVEVACGVDGFADKSVAGKAHPKAPHLCADQFHLDGAKGEQDASGGGFTETVEGAAKKSPCAADIPRWIKDDGVKVAEHPARNAPKEQVDLVAVDVGGLGCDKVEQSGIKVDDVDLSCKAIRQDDAAEVIVSDKQDAPVGFGGDFEDLVDAAFGGVGCAVELVIANFDGRALGKAGAGRWVRDARCIGTLVIEGEQRGGAFCVESCKEALDAGLCGVAVEKSVELGQALAQMAEVGCVLAWCDVGPFVGERIAQRVE